MWRLVIALLSCSLGVARAVRDSDLGLLLDVEETGRSEGQEIGESQMTVEEYFNFGPGISQTRPPQPGPDIWPGPLANRRDRSARERPPVLIRPHAWPAWV